MPHIFVSHASADAAWANSAVSELERRGLTCWIAPRNIPPGAVYQQSLWDALQASSAVLFVHSSQSSGSAHVLRELEVGTRFGVPIVPVQIDQFTPTGASGYMIAGLQLVRLSQAGEDDWSNLTRVLDGARSSVRDLSRLERVFENAGYSDEEARRRSSALDPLVASCGGNATGALACLQVFSQLPFLDAPEREASMLCALEEWLNEVSVAWEQGTDLIWPKAGDKFDPDRMIAVHEPRVGTWGSYPPVIAGTVRACLRPGLVVVGPASVPFGRIQAVVRTMSATDT